MIILSIHILCNVSNQRNMKRLMSHVQNNLIRSFFRIKEKNETLIMRSYHYTKESFINEDIQLWISFLELTKQSVPNIEYFSIEFDTAYLRFGFWLNGVVSLVLDNEHHSWNSYSIEFVRPCCMNIKKKSQHKRKSSGNWNVKSSIDFITLAFM